MTINNQKGISGILALLLGLAVLGGIFYFIAPKVIDGEKMNLQSLKKSEEVVEDVKETLDSSDYTELTEPEGVPAGVDNVSLDEIDELMMEIDSTSDEDLSDL